MASKKSFLTQDNNPVANNPLFKAQDKPKEQTKPKEKKGKKGRPINKDLVRGNSVQEGLTEEYTRATFILKVKNLERLKDYAYTERLSMKDAINSLLESALEQEENRLSEEGIELLSKGK